MSQHASHKNITNNLSCQPLANSHVSYCRCSCQVFNCQWRRILGTLQHQALRLVALPGVQEVGIA
jgi:hypothetical protein